MGKIDISMQNTCVQEKQNMFFNLKRTFYVMMFIKLILQSFHTQQFHSEDGSLLNTYIRQRQAQTLYRHCKKNSVSTVEAMHEYFLSCKHTMSVPQKTNDTRVQTTYSVLTHRLGKSFQELISYKLSRKDCVFCHLIDCTGDGAETCSRGIKEGHRESTSSEIRQTMNAQSVWKYLV